MEHAAGTVARRVFLVGVIAQTAIVITGGIVRLTGSGLGCPSWPKCTPGLYTPVVRQPQGFHTYIEFGNRTLTFFVLLAVVACIVAALQQRPRRRPLVLLASAGAVGVLGQAVLGGITVRTHLNPATVAAHFLLSMVLIAAALILYERGNEDGDGPAQPLVRPEVRWLGRVLVAAAALVLVLGTLVTGSGPHSGDANQPARFGFNPQVVAWLHADMVIAFIGLLLALILALRLTDAPLRAQRRAWILLGIALAQGTIGYVQYFTGLPEAVVAAHLLGACLVWIFTLRGYLSLRVRHARDGAQSSSARRTAEASRSGAASS